MLTIPKTVEMDEVTKTKKINCKFLAGNAVEHDNNTGVINHLRFCNPAPMDDEVGRPPPLAAVNGVDNNINGTDDAVAEQQFL